MMRFFFCVVWSVGANLADRSRDKFDEFLRKRLGYLVPTLPDEKTVFDYMVFVENQMARWIEWSSRVDNFSYDPETPYFNILVPTADTTKFRYMLQHISSIGAHTMLMSETGCGKTVIVQDFLKRAGDGFVSCPVIFSAQTTARNLQDVFESKLEKKSRKLLGPPAGKKLIFFIDDLNMPEREIFGAQPPIELLRQCIDNEGFYDL